MPAPLAVKVAEAPLHNRVLDVLTDGADAAYPTVIPIAEDAPDHPQLFVA